MISCRIFDMNSSESDSVVEDNDLRIYAVLNLRETPRKLLSKGDKKGFFCYFALPLPPQVIIFAVGEWESAIGSSTISVEVSLNSESQPKRIGTLSKEARALCWQSDWGKNFTERSLKLLEEDRMAKLVLAVESNNNQKENKKAKKTPFSPGQTNTKDLEDSPKASVSKINKNNLSKFLTPKNKSTKLDDYLGIDSQDNENTPIILQGTPPAPPSFCENRRKRTPRGPSVALPARKRRKSLHLSESPSPTVTNNSPSSRKLSSPKVASPPSTPSTPYSPCVFKEGGPSGRWGHAMCNIDDSKTVLIGGQGAKHQMVKDALWVISSNETGKSEWKQQFTSNGTGADRRMGHSISYDPESKAVYVYGGSKNKRWYSDVHKLDTVDWAWSIVKTVGKAPTRAYHSCTLFHGEMWVFGGVYPNPDPQPDGCSNDMFVLNLQTKNWYTPIVGSTSKPCPRSGHSACMFDDILVIFGGWDAPTCYNDLFFLDLTIMEYTKPITTGMAPSKRSWQASVKLPGNRMLIHGGYNGIQTLADAFIFDLGSLTWTAIQTPESLYPRAGHAAICLPNKQETTDKIAIFGGGDNLGEFFSDFLIFYPQPVDSC